MIEKIYFCLFILYGIIYQAITEVSLEDLSGSNPLIRRKRVINLEPNGDIPLRAGDAPFVVHIKESPSNTTVGVGTILSRHTVITSAKCIFHLRRGSIQIRTGSIFAYRGNIHNVIDKKLHFGRHLESHWEGIALLTVELPIAFEGHAGHLELHEEPLLPGTPGTIFGWGCNPKSPRGTNYRNTLRSITVLTMPHRDCVNIYRDYVEIKDTDICTYDANKKCGHTDSGAPLVVDNRLAGIYLLTGSLTDRINPDVFLVVQDLEYSQWIKNNIVHHI